MVKLSLSALAIAACLGSTAMLTNSQHPVPSSVSAEAILATDGAFRDGLYLGRMAAERGQALRPAIGRWSTDRDRSMFAAGYRRGYESRAGAATARTPD